MCDLTNLMVRPYKGLLKDPLWCRQLFPLQAARQLEVQAVLMDVWVPKCFNYTAFPRVHLCDVYKVQGKY